MDNINFEEVVALRAALRSVLPIEPEELLRDEVLSAGFGLLEELTVRRIAQGVLLSKGKCLSSDEVKLIQEAVSNALNKALAGVILHYVPDTLISHRQAGHPESTE